MVGLTKNAILILTPFQALEIYAALELLEDQKNTTRALQKSIWQYKKQINEHLTEEQLDDAEAERSVLMLLGKYK